MDTYLPSFPARILEIGAQNVNGSLRDHAPRNAEYVGLDFEAGNGVDIVVTGIDDWNVPDAHFDLVMASSVFEHDKAFWRTFLAMCAKTKPGGHIYISSPSNGTVHRYPQDYWRFYPDSGLALEEWARDEGYDITLIESFIGERQADVWNDFCAVFRRGPSQADLNRDFVFDKVSSTNAVSWRSKAIINPVDDSQDTRLLCAAKDETQWWVRHAEHLNAVHAEELTTHLRQIDELTQAIESHTSRLAVLDADAEGREKQVALFEGSLSELQSRLAQRDEEAAQAWGAADTYERERNALAAEAGKIQTQLADANDWVSKLALSRTQTERKVASLEKSLSALSRDFERSQQRNGALEERIAELSAQSVVVPVPPQPEVVTTAVEHVEQPAIVPQQVEQPAVVPQHIAPMPSPRAENRSEHANASIKAELSESLARLDECQDELAALGDLLASAQDRIAELERQNGWLRDAGCFLLERGKWWWRFMPLSWQQQKRDRRLHMRELFNSETYARRYPDVALSGQDPFRHYIHHGIAENRRFD